MSFQKLVLVCLSSLIIAASAECGVDTANGELVISATDARYTKIVEPWQEHALPGYMLSSIQQWGPLEAQGNRAAGQVVTRVADLLPDTYHVYLRYGNRIRAMLAGVDKEPVTYGLYNSDRVAPMSSASVV